MDVDSSGSGRAPGRSRWLTAVVLAVVAGFFAATLVRNWRQVTAVKWSVAPGYFALACILLALSYALVAGLWGVALRRVTAVGVAAGARIWFLSNLARYVPGNVWSFVGAVELARREGAPRRATLAVMALTQALSVGLALLVGLPVLVAERGRLGRPAVIGAVLLLVLGVAAVLLWRPLERLARRRFPGMVERLRGGEGGGRLLPPAGVVAGLAAGYAVYWVLTGLAFAALVRAAFPLEVSSVPLAVAGYAAGYAVGFLSIVTPAGLGVREGVLVLALAPVMPAGPALVVALASRLWMMLLELLGAAVAYGVDRALTRPPAHAGR